MHPHLGIEQCRGVHLGNWSFVSVYFSKFPDPSFASVDSLKGADSVDYLWGTRAEQEL